MGGEQRCAGTDQAVEQRALGVLAATVSTPRNSSGWWAAGLALADAVDHRGGGVHTATVTESTGRRGSAHQTDGVPVVRQMRRVGLVEDVGSHHRAALIATPPPPRATSTGPPGRTAARR